MPDFLKSFMRKKQRLKHITITLEELSVLWTKYNRQYKPVAAPAVSDESINAVVTPVALEDAAYHEDAGQDKAIPAETAPAAQEQSAARVIDAFIQDTVQPYRDYCAAQNALEPILAILKLLETHGSCPSIGKTSSRMSDTDMDYVSVQDALVQVTLRDHSLRVASIAVSLLKKTYADYETLVPRMLISSLAHDIGKIPSLRPGGDYVKADHPIIGAEKLKEILSAYDEGSRVAWLDKAVDDVKSHHRPSKDQFLSVLQAADAQARNEEVALYRKDFVFKEWKDWFSLDELLEALKKEINVVQPKTKNEWQAFSFNSVVYVKSNVFYTLAVQQAKNKKIFDIGLMRASNKRPVMQTIVKDILDRQGVVGEEFAPGYYGQLYEINFGTHKDRQFMTPLKIELFGMASDIENDKSGYFFSIQGVRALSAKAPT